MKKSQEERLILNFGKAMKILREKKGMTQGDIVRRTGLERSYVSRLESNKIKYPRVEMVSRLAKAFDISIEEFVKIASNTRG